MTESQIKQFAISQKALEKKCEKVNQLNSLLGRIMRCEGSGTEVRYNQLDNLFRYLWRIDEAEVARILVSMSERIAGELQTEIDNTSLLDILSEIEKG